MFHVMADNVDDVGSFIGKSNSSNNISSKQIDLTQIHQQQQIFDDAEHITTTVSTTSDVSVFHQFTKIYRIDLLTDISVHSLKN